MALLKLTDFDPDYRQTFDGNDIKGYGVYTDSDDKVGSISDVLVDEEGRFRYFIVDLGFWIFGKKVLMPVGRARVDNNEQRIYAVGLTKEQAEALPEFNEDMALDYDYEESVRGVYRPSTATATTGTSVGSATSTYNTGISASPAVGAAGNLPIDASAPLEASAPLDSDYSTTRRDTYAEPIGTEAAYGTTTSNYTGYDRDTYSYQNEPALYDLNERDHQTLRLYEERLVANKRRVKTGDVTVGKHVETETERVSVPVEKERIVVERVTPTDAGRPVAPGEATFREGEVARMEVYEETADVRKEAFVREEVNVRKEVDQEIVNAEETIRREEIDINTGNLPVDEQRDRI